MTASCDILIRTHGGPEIGMGHLSRCRTLAVEFNRLGHEVGFVVSGDPDCAAWLRDWPVRFVTGEDDPASWPPAPLCLVDLYCFEEAYYQRLHGYYPKLAVFDDIEFKIPAPVGAVINATVYAKPEAYPDHLLRLVGPQYFAIRDELRGRRRREDAGRVLVCLGGSDPQGQTEPMVRAARLATSRPIDAVLGPGFRDEAMAGRLAEMKGVTVHRAPANLPDIMERACWAVCAGGVMIYELAHLGIPLACLVLTNDQEPNAKAMAQRGAGIDLGRYDQLGLEQAAGLLARLEQDGPWRESLGKRAAALIDGQGAQRVAAELARWALGNGAASTGAGN